MVKSRINERTFFDFLIGKYRFVFKENYKHTDRETGKVYMNKKFLIENDLTHEDWVSFYTGWDFPRIEYDTVEYENNRHNLRISLGWGLLYIRFPWRNKKVNEEDINNPQPKYGFYFYGEGKFPDSLWYHTNKNGHNYVKCIRLPWSYEFYRHSILLKDKTWWTCLEKDRIKASKEGVCLWNDKKYNLYEDDTLIMKESFPFKYTTKGGEVQETTATCFLEEREWRPLWFGWTKLFSKVKTSLSISFNDEMGNQRGSWKGGVMGTSSPVTTEEKNTIDFLTPLRRFEEKVNLTHEFDR